MSALSPRSGIQVSSVYPTYTHIKGQCPECVCVRVCVRACMFVCVCVCVAKPVTVELRCHATALILVIGKAQFRRAMLSCDSSCFEKVRFRDQLTMCDQYAYGNDNFGVFN